MSLALNPIAPDEIFIKFDSSAENKPKCISIVTCDSLYLWPYSSTGYNYQPDDFLSFITIDDFTPYLETGFKISGIDSFNLMFNDSIFIPDTIPPTTTNSLNSGYYTTEQEVVLTANEESTTYYKVDEQQVQTYLGPLTLSSSCVFTFWSVDSTGNIEPGQVRTYYIDLNPLVVKLTPKPSVYRETNIKFILSKPGQIFWSYRTYGQNNPYVSEQSWTDWTDFEELVSKQFTLTASIDILYQAVSEGITYPVQSVTYFYDPNAKTITITPSAFEVYDKDEFIVTLGNNYE